jgi:hypothetical protein
MMPYVVFSKEEGQLLEVFTPLTPPRLLKWCEYISYIFYGLASQFQMLLLPCLRLPQWPLQASTHLRHLISQCIEFQLYELTVYSLSQ